MDKKLKLFRPTFSAFFVSAVFCAVSVLAFADATTFGNPAAQQAFKQMQSTSSSLGSSAAGLQSAAKPNSSSSGSGSNGLTQTDNDAGINFARMCAGSPNGRVSGSNPDFIDPAPCILFYARATLRSKSDDSFKPALSDKKSDATAGAAVKDTIDVKSKPNWSKSYQEFLSRIPNFVLGAWLDPTHQVKDSSGMGGPLITRKDGAAKDSTKTSTDSSNTYSEQNLVDDSGNPIVTSTGEKRAIYSIKYKTNAQALEDGACQMIGTGTGPYNFTPMKDATIKLTQGSAGASTAAPAGASSTITAVRPASKQPRGGAMQGDYEAILALDHPFAPRNQPDWQNRVSPSIAYADMAQEHSGSTGGDSGGGGGGSSTASKAQSAAQIEQQKYTYTWVCGLKKFPLAIDLTSVFAGGGSVSSSTTKGMSFGNIGPKNQAWEKGFDYYKKPVKDHGGKILVNNTQNPAASVPADKDRDGKFQKPFHACYWAIYIACTASSEGVGATICAKIALETCEYSECRAYILPPVTPINRLKMAYNLAPQGPSGGAAGGPPSAPSSLPFIYEENRAGHPNAYQPQADPAGAEYVDEGMSYYYSNPAQNFGYSMPPLKHWPSGQPASNGVIKATGGVGQSAMSQWEPWREAIVGVNKYFMPDESNEMEANSHNMSAQHGGWNELKLYQARCLSWFGLNCICDWEKNFFPGTSLGYVLFRAGAAINISNEQKYREQSVNMPTPSGYASYLRNPLGTVVTDKTTQAYIDRDIPINKGETRFKAIFRQYVGNKAFPGQVKGGDIKGLDNAAKGDIIILAQDKTKAKNTGKRPDIAYFVEQVRGDKCLRVTTANNGTLFDAYEVTENWGIVTERVMCPPGSGKGSDGSSNTSSGGVDQIQGIDPADKGTYPSCSYPNVVQCTEDDWDDWVVWQWKGKKAADGTYPNWDDRQFDPETGKLMQ